MTLYTADETRTAFLTTAVAILESVNTTDVRLARLIAGKGNIKRLPASQQHAVYVHWAQLAELIAAGHRWIIGQEIEGLLSCVEVEGAAGAASTIASQLPASHIDHHPAIAA